MAKFLIGLVAGLLLAALSVVILIFAAVRLGEAPPAVSARSVLVLDLDGEIVERPPDTLPLPFLEERAPLTTTDLWRSLKAAETDSRIKAVVLMPGRIEAGWGKLQELRGSLEGLVKSGKPVFAFLRTPSTREYYLATAAGRIYMPPEDMLDVKGLRAEAHLLPRHPGQDRRTGGNRARRKVQGLRRHVHPDLHEPRDPRGA